jgi:hypothetical protein
MRRAASKYRAIKTEVDGVLFDSKREAAHYCELKLRQKAGEIDLLELQPEFALVVSGVVVGKYRADFRYVLTHNGELVVDDSKGFRTPVYRLKKKIVEAIYGIEIQEV